MKTCGRVQLLSVRPGLVPDPSKISTGNLIFKSRSQFRSAITLPISSSTMTTFKQLMEDHMNDHDRNAIVDTLIDAKNFITQGKDSDLNMREQRLLDRINTAIELMIGS